MEMYKVTFNVNKLYSNQAQYDKLVKGTEPYGYVYAWENLWNWNMYVGQTIDLDEREKQHIRDHKQVIDGAIDKYGEENFDRYIIDVGYSKEELDEREKYWIKYYNTFEGKGYNCDEGGGGIKGYKHTKEVKKKMSKSRKGESNPMYGRTGELNPMYGKKHSDEAKKKMSEAKKGKYIGESNPMYGRTGEKNPNFGKKRNDEVKKKISEALKGEKNGGFKGYILVTNAKTGEFVGVYIGTYEIERELKSTKGKKLYHSAISTVLNGKLKSHGGYTYKRLSLEEYEAWKQSQAS